MTVFSSLKQAYRGALPGLIFIFCLPGLFCAREGARQEAEPAWQAARRHMVQVLKYYGIVDENVLAAMAKVPRHLFVPQDYRGQCHPYGDHPCPIGHGQTISQPYIVAYMTEKLNLRSGEKVLEVGTGSGYQAALLHELGTSVYTIERIHALAIHAAAVFKELGFKNIHPRFGDGYRGWPEEAPFDAIIVTCAPARIPEALPEQLKEGGRMIVPVGSHFQKLIILTKKNGKIERRDDIGVRFVPMLEGERK